MRHSADNGVAYYRCKKKDKYLVRAIILGHFDIIGRVEVQKNHKQSVHEHAPDREESNALKMVSELNRQAAEHPETAPIHILRTVQNVSEGVLAQLPDRDNL